MSPASRTPRWFPALAAGALSAALAFALVRPGAPEAGAGDDPPLAVAGPVRLYGALAGEGRALAVRVRAVNGGARAQRCRVTATVTELRDSPMSRVVRMPRPLWTTELAVAVEAGATAERQVDLPAGVARQLATEADQLRRAGAPPELVSHRVSLEAACPSDESVG